jgi:hypothetical protein
MYNPFLRVIALGVFAALGLGAGEADAAAAKLDTANFVAACAADQIVVEDPAFEDGKVTPKTYCECVAGKLEENKLSQTDVDMLTKMHNEDISDSDAENYPTLEDLLVANEGFEDACKTSLGLPAGDENEMEEEPDEDGATPDNGTPDGDQTSPPE